MSNFENKIVASQIPKGTSVDELYLMLNSWTEAIKEKDSHGWKPLQLSVENEAIEVVSLMLNSWIEAIK